MKTHKLVSDDNEMWLMFEKSIYKELVKTLKLYSFGKKLNFQSITNYMDIVLT